MEKRIFEIGKRAFTLIELLIVVAIIAILAAIAVPNFLEAQVRSKVSRCLADARSIRTALESYVVDNNRYPETDFGQSAYNDRFISIHRLTTPVAFMTSIPRTPFSEKFGASSGPTTKIATLNNTFLYVRRELVSRTPASTTLSPDGLCNECDSAYVLDRTAYLPQTSLAATAAVSRDGKWLMKSVGPNNIDDRDGAVFSGTARIYDSTNGTVSDGDIVFFSDRAGTGKEN